MEKYGCTNIHNIGGNEEIEKRGKREKQERRKGREGKMRRKAKGRGGVLPG